MTEIQPKYDDEIDLIEFFETLWVNKVIISGFVSLAVLFGVVFLLVNDDLYESNINYSIDTIPPFYSQNQVLNDFKNKFYSQKVFSDWKKDSDTSLVFENLSETKIIDGYVISKSEDELFVKFDSKKEDNSYLVVKSNQLSILNEFFEYAEHINETLKKDYVVRANRDLEIIKDITTNSRIIDSEILPNIRDMISIYRFITSIKNGENLIKINRPNNPVKVSPKSTTILTISFLLGGMGGVFFVYARNLIKKRKEQSIIV